MSAAILNLIAGIFFEFSLFVIGFLMNELSTDELMSPMVSSSLPLSKSRLLFGLEAKLSGWTEHSFLDSVLIILAISLS